MTGPDAGSGTPVPYSPPGKTAPTQLPPRDVGPVPFSRPAETAPTQLPPADVAPVAGPVASGAVPTQLPPADVAPVANGAVPTQLPPSDDGPVPFSRPGETVPTQLPPGEGALAPAVVRTRAELRAFPRAGRIAVVMTMGALHEGHAALLREARKNADFVIATIFVNPLQFAPNEDLARYPRTFEADLAVCAAEGVDLIFAPPPQEMYPAGEPVVTVHPGPLGDQLEGAIRPGHFTGVLTVVLKLLNLTRPGVAFFGEKDYQQLTLIRAMVRDLEVGTEIVGVPTVREADGLALSSRNRYLSDSERALSLALSRALRKAAQEHTAGAVLATAARELAGLTVDYLELRDPELGPPPARGAARLLVAARIGTTRLIDNTPLELS